MRITSIKAVPISYRVPEGQNVRLGIGRAVKRDAVLVKGSRAVGLELVATALRGSRTEGGGT